MTSESPAGEAMSREGKGTAAESEQGNSRPVPWADVQARLAQGGWYWLATVRPDGAPHVMPVFAAWSESVFYVASKDTARKSRNLAADGRCVVSSDKDDVHLVVEGEARQVTDQAGLQRASGAFDTVYGWPTVVVAGKLDSEYGAPTSGGPPYDVYKITPTKAFAFPTDGESITPTRWRFTG
ncbi:MAG: pyridoxamine 5'-phosphate oxidase family protein [Streptosporangiales bacterium]|nr:pyridoxamine 5'-phosphate oxidase family protein [Streptosporangiales bacterium]